MIKYVDVTRVAELETIEQVNEQIKLRSELMDQMVGNLYPSILRDEIEILRHRCIQIKETMKPLEYVHES